MIREALSEYTQLSKSVVKQHFGTLKMEDDNEVKQEVAHEVNGQIC